jgi:glycosyltransferase involved in cell wall biosynthesis
VRISIVIPAHNAGGYLAQTIESVLAQSATEWELVIVDDGSADRTAGVARIYAARDPRIRLIQQVNSGVAAARNRGLAECSPFSAFQAFLDHDDLWEEHALQTLADALEAQPEAVAASGLSRIVDRRGRPVAPGQLESWCRDRQGVRGKRLVRWPTGAPTTLGVLAYRNCIYTPGQALIRRSALDATGSFDPAASPCDDWDIWLRLSRLGSIVCVDEVLLNWRAHQGNACAQDEIMARQMAYVRGKLLRSPGLSARERHVIRLANWYWGLHLCRERLRAARSTLGGGNLWDAAAQTFDAMSRAMQCLRGLPAS